MIVRKKLNLEERIKLPNESGLRKEMVLVFKGWEMIALKVWTGGHAFDEEWEEIARRRGKLEKSFYLQSLIKNKYEN